MRTASPACLRAGMLLAVACVGEGKVGHDDVAWLPTEEEEVVIDCAEQPAYNLASLDCAQLGNAFEHTLGALSACNVPSDCVAVHPRCEGWSAVDCYYAANYCASPQVIEAFDVESEGCADPSNVCDCRAPPDVSCVNNVCVLQEAGRTR